MDVPPPASFPVPSGWFHLPDLDDISPGEARPVRAFGRDLVVWHDGDRALVHDAFCPHLGAHLGHGGCVRDGSLVCPFHG
jgi:phenylpropionate dioxygenase-like ring-hydroxylating dioxygenase large terminal subunit